MDLLYILKNYQKYLAKRISVILRPSDAEFHAKRNYTATCYIQAKHCMLYTRFNLNSLLISIPRF